MAAASAALAAPPGKGTEAALLAYRQQQQQRQAGDAYAAGAGETGGVTGGWRVEGVPVATGIPVSDPPNSVPIILNPLASHGPAAPLPPPQQPQPYDTSFQQQPRPSQPPEGSLSGFMIGDPASGGAALVPEQQHPLFNAGQLFYIERRGESWSFIMWDAHHYHVHHTIIMDPYCFEAEGM